MHRLAPLDRSGNVDLFHCTVEASGMTGGFYHVGDRLAGEVVLTAREDVAVKSVVVRLHYVVEGSQSPRSFLAAEVPLASLSDVRAGRQLRYPLRSPTTFGSVTSRTPQVQSYWKLTVEMERRPQPVGGGLLGRVTTGRRAYQALSFEVPVVYGRGQYRARARDLPVPLFSEAGWGWGLGLAAMAVFLTLVSVQGRVSLRALITLPGIVLLATLAYQYLYMNTFQATPAELLPGRDGRLRLRLLDRGNDHFRRARVGVRMQERYTVSRSDHEVERKTVNRYVFDRFFRDVARRQGTYYLVDLPWPKGNLPVSLDAGEQGYRWEVFLSQPNPVTGREMEIAWPVTVEWESYRIRPASAEETDRERLELMDPDELPEALPLPQRRDVRRG